MDSHPLRTGKEWALTDVALVVKGAAMEPAMVTRVLRLQPTAEVRPDAEGRHPNSADAGEWRLQYDERSFRDFPAQLRALLTDIEPQASGVNQLQAEGYDVCISVYGFAGSGCHILIPEDAIGRISRLGIPLELVPNLNDR